VCFLRIFCGGTISDRGTRSGLLIKRVFLRAVLLDAFGGIGPKKWLLN